MHHALWTLPAKKLTNVQHESIWLEGLTDSPHRGIAFGMFHDALAVEQRSKLGRGRYRRFLVSRGAPMPD